MCSCIPGGTGDAVDFGQQVRAVLLGLQQGVGDLVQAKLGPLNGFDGAAALLLAILRSVGHQALAQLGEAGRQAIDSAADLPTGQIQVLPPHGQNTRDKRLQTLA